MINKTSQQGQILIIGIVIMAVLVTMSASLWGYTTMQIKSSRQAVSQSQALNLAEAGIDKAIYELNQDSSFNGEADVALGPGEYTTTIATIDPNNKQIVSTGYIPDSVNPVSQVTVKLNVTLDLSNVAFNFGVQVGVGGLVMDNNSQVNGNVYSNGDISGGSGVITGDAVVAGGGSPTTDQECSTSDSDFSMNQNDRKDVAMKFTPAVSGPLTKVSLYLRKSGSPSDITVRVVTNNSNEPSKTQVGGNGTVSSSSVTGSYGWIDASFSSSPELTAGTAYWLILDTSSTTSNYYVWGRQSNESACAGIGSYSSNWNQNPNPTWTSAAADFNIRTYMGGVPTRLSDITVNGNARAHILENCSIGADAYYDTTNSCTVSGTTYSGESDSPPQSMPISQAQIDEWKSVASGGGVHSGSYSVSGTDTIGPLKIEGDLVVTLGSTLYLTGPVWVEGDITIENNSAVRVDNSLGNSGTVLLADDPEDQANKGLVDIANNAIIAGNNSAGSYAIVITTKSGTAMNVTNNAIGAIYYAANGTVDVANNAGGAQVTGYRIHLNENAEITYSTGLQSATFANGPGGSWAKVDGTYIIVP